MKYKGFEIKKSNGMGKAGKNAKTYSIQIVQKDGSGNVIKKSFPKIPKNHFGKKIQAIQKAKNFIDRNLASE